MIQNQLRDKKVLTNGQNDKRQADTRDKVHKNQILKQNGQNTKQKILTKWSEEKILRTNKRPNENA